MTQEREVHFPSEVTEEAATLVVLVVTNVPGFNSIF